MVWPAIIGAIGAIGGGLLSSRGAKDAANAASQGNQQKIDPRLETMLYGGNIDGKYHPGALDYLRHQFQKGIPNYYPGETVARTNPFHQAGFGTAMSFNNSGNALGGYNAVQQHALSLLNKGKQPGDPGYQPFQQFQPARIDEAAFWERFNAAPPSFGRQPITYMPHDLQPGMRPPLGDGSDGQGGVNQGGEAPDNGKGSMRDRVRSKLPGAKPSLGKLFGF